MTNKEKLEMYSGILIFIILFSFPFFIELYNAFLYISLITILAVVFLVTTIHKEYFDLKFYNKWKIRRHQHYFIHFLGSFIHILLSFMIGTYLVPFTVDGSKYYEWIIDDPRVIFYPLILIFFGTLIMTQLKIERNNKRFDGIHDRLVKASEE